ncbi:winged helix-turn-helix transcriptional regulator [Sphingomonas sp.]|uniref:winged helix-turn-helix transcriptional regulator n=1 Tax=Sphingomonas sp. TaxID=28214 RepID=UPI003B0002D9
MKSEKVTEAGKDTEKRWYDDACGTALGMELVGERWSLLVVRELMFGPRRFGEIKANLPGISANVLTQRLDGLAVSGIAVRRRLPSPANVQVYDLTDWGREAETAIRALGRWAARSPRHDPMLFMSPASAMVSLRTLIDPVKARTLSATVAFRLPTDGFVAMLADGELAIGRGVDRPVDVIFTGDTMALRRSLYGKEGFDREGLLAVEGDGAVAQRFADLFALPAKLAA